MTYVYSFLTGALSMIGFLVVLYVVFYTAAHGWTLGAERATRKARKEWLDD